MRWQERGSQVVEFLCLVPLWLLVAAALWQTALAGRALVAAEAAAQAAARAAAAAPAPDRLAAARRAAELASGGLELDGPPGVEALDHAALRVTVRLRVPLVGRPGASWRWLVTRTVTIVPAGL